MENIKDPLFVSLTRPALKWGIPLDALMVIAILTMIIYIASSNFLLLASYIPLHLSLFFICKKDPRIIKMLALWLNTKLLSTGWKHWGAASASPRDTTCNKKKIPL